MLKKKSAVEQAIEDNLIAANKHLTDLDPGTPEYKDTLDGIKILSSVLTEVKLKKVDPDVIAQVLGYVGAPLSIGLIEAFGHVISSKSMSLISPLRMKK